MALTTPRLLTVSAFDATESQTFYFSVVGGTQVASNKLVISNQETNTVVYQEVQQSYTLEHTLPADTLTNGEYYSAYVITYDGDGNASSNSNEIQFYCYTTPNFVITNIPSSGIVQSFSLDVSLYYEQEENEALVSYNVILYDAQQVQIASSGLQYVGGSTPPNTLTYTFNGLSNATTYYVSANGITDGGTNISTILYSFVSQYEQSSAFSIVELTNNCSGGYITVKSNFIDITGNSSPARPSFSDGYINLTGSNSYVNWNNGFKISGNFTARLWGKNFTKDNPIIVMTSTTGETISVYYRTELDDDGDVKSWVELVVTNGTNSYYLSSKPCTTVTEVTVDTELLIGIERLNGLYAIGIYETSSTDTDDEVFLIDRARY